MSKERDEKILLLKKEIEKKENILAETTTIFLPKTNCNLTDSFLGDRVNLHTLSKEEDIDLLLVKINTLNLSQKSLGLKDVKIAGFAIEDWLSDLMTIKAVLKNKKEAKNLEQKKEELLKLLSEDKKTDLLLEKLEKELLN